MADGDLLVIVPSRGRPGNVERLVAAMSETCRADTALLVGLDDDDATATAYPAGTMYEVCSGMRQVGAWLNELAPRYARDWPAIGHFGDDNVPITAGWDERMLEALQVTPFAFGNDLYPRTPGSLPCHIFMRSQVITALGYMAPPSMRHMVDLAWREWGNDCGITFLEDVIIEHLHWSVQKAPMDQTYADVNAVNETDWAAFGAYFAGGGLAADLAKIRATL